MEIVIVSMIQPNTRLMVLHRQSPCISFLTDPELVAKVLITRSLQWPENIINGVHHLTMQPLEYCLARPIKSWTEISTYFMDLTEDGNDGPFFLAV